MVDQPGSPSSAGEFKRRHKRHAADLPIHVNATRGDLLEEESGRMVDVSEGGLCFIGARYLPPGTHVDIDFEDCQLSGHVRQCRLREYASHVEFVTGIQIERILSGMELWRNLTQGLR